MKSIDQINENRCLLDSIDANIIDLNFCVLTISEQEEIHRIRKFYTSLNITLLERTMVYEALREIDAKEVDK